MERFSKDDRVSFNKNTWKIENYIHKFSENVEKS